MRLLAIIFGLLAAESAGAQAVSMPVDGQSIAEVIETYRDSGTPFAYSTNLVTDDLKVTVKPSPGSAVDVLRQILLPHGLTVRSEAGVHLVVRLRANELQPGNIVLVLTSDTQTRPLEAPRVTVEPELRSVSKLKPGIFEYADVRPGRYRFSVEADGYETARRVVDVWPGETAVVTIGVEEAKHVIETINVSASRYEILREVAGSRFVLDQRTIETMPDLGDDPIRIVQRLPGAAASGASAKTHLRGGETDEVGIMLNGQRLFDPFHIRDYQGVFSTIDSRAIEGVEVYTGGFPVQFGNRMSGMVLMESLEAQRPRHTELGISVFNTSLLTTGYDADRDWLFSGRRGNLDLVLNPKLGSPAYYDVFGHYGWDLSDSMSISINALYADDRVEVVLESDPEERESVVSDTANAQAWIRLDNRWSEQLSSSTVLSAVSFDNHRRGSLNDEEKIVATLSDDRRITRFGLRQDFSYRQSDQHHLQWGLQVTYSSADYEYRNTAEYFGLQALYPDQPESISRSLEATPNGAAYAIYIADRWQLSDRSVLEWGLRWDDQTFTDNSSDAQISPRVSYLRALGDDTELRASWGRYHQSQEINELQIEDGITRFWPAQRADHLIVGVQHRLSERLSARLELFHKDIRDVRPRFENLFDPLGLIPEVQPDRIRLDPASALSQGLELSLEHFSNETAWWASYVLSKASDRIAGDDQLRSWDQRHALQGGFSWSNERWDFSVAASVRSGWPRTRLDLIQTGVDENGEPEFVAIPGPRNAGRHATFASLDMRLARRWKLERSSLMAFLEVSNLTNRRNQCCLDFDLEEDEDSGELVFDEGVDYWTPLLPAIGILWEF